MGQCQGHRAVHGSQIFRQYHFNQNRTVDDEQSSPRPQERPKQKRAGGRRLRLWQNEILAEAEPPAMPQLLCGHRSKGL